MKCATLAAVIGVAFGATAALAQPHRHGHHHFHERRAAEPEALSARDVQAAGKTLTIYELNGHQISAADVHQGIANGSLVWSPHGAAAGADTKPAAVDEDTVLRVPASPSPAASSSTPAPASTPDASPPPPKAAPPPPKAAPSPPSGGSASGGASGSSSSGSFNCTATGSDTPFPDGQLDCSEFPSQYGAISVDWVGLGGWTGVQNPGSASGGFSNIMTVTSNLCVGGACCTEGSFCSYACQPGYQKVQWPSMQGSTGQSVGGIQCSGGKLRLTNKNYNTLCAPGAQQVKVQVKNTMNQVASVCRTDYPGTEGETVPLSADPGTTSPLTMPDAANYYTWQNSPTSAQYYVNPAGVPVQKACQWGSAANPWGNFAPMNLGVGYSNGRAWVSMFQNLPTTSTPLNFAVEIIGDNLVGSCKYANGQFCTGTNYQSCSSSGQGCTVSAASGTITYVFS